MSRLIPAFCWLLMALAIGAPTAERPMTLLFPVISGQGADPDITVEATQAIKTYLRQTGKTDVVDFDPDSALVQRAIIEHSIDLSELADMSTPEARLRMAAAVGADLAASGDIVVEDNEVTVGVWLAQTETRKVCRSGATVSIAESSRRKLAVSNALQSAASTVVYQLVNEVLKDVKPDTSGDVNNAESQLIVPDRNISSSAGEASLYIGNAEEMVKTGDLAGAIVEYRKAVNADPRNTDIRLKLVQLYIKRQLYVQALDEIERARAIDPENQALDVELAGIYEAKGDMVGAGKVYEDQAAQRPKDMALRLRAGDYYVKQRMPEEAEEQYRLAVEINPSNPTPHERLVILLALQSLFNESRKELDELSKLSPVPAVDPEKRYSELWGFAQRSLNVLLRQYDDGSALFSSKQMTRESFYDIVRGIGIRTDSISNYLQGIEPPESASSVHRHRILGCSLLSQACEHTMAYLETNSAAEKDDAAIFLSEAKKHLSAS